MNIFAVSDDPILSGQWQHDKHTCKMTLETAQLVSQAVRLRPAFREAFKRDLDKLYRTTHQHHPSSRWARASTANLEWLCKHGLALAEEYNRRYRRGHKSERIIGYVAEALADMPAEPLTPFAQAMPDVYKDADPVVAYRLYYTVEKVPGAAWKRRDHLPDWLLRAIYTRESQRIPSILK